MSKPTSYLTNPKGNAKKISLIQQTHPIFSTLYTDLQSFLNSIENKGYNLSIDTNFSIYDANGNFIAKVVFFNNKNHLSPKIILEAQMGTVYKKCSNTVANNIMSQFGYKKYYKSFSCITSNFLSKLDSAL